MKYSHFEKRVVSCLIIEGSMFTLSDNSNEISQHYHWDTLSSVNTKSFYVNGFVVSQEMAKVYVKQLKRDND